MHWDKDIQLNLETECEHPVYPWIAYVGILNSYKSNKYGSLCDMF